MRRCAMKENKGWIGIAQSRFSEDQFRAAMGASRLSRHDRFTYNRPRD
jgi:hypothetical protein